eukprot:6214846-Pleurochrysis_carterae.AAC.5
MSNPSAPTWKETSESKAININKSEEAIKIDAFWLRVSVSRASALECNVQMHSNSIYLIEY